MAFIFPAIRKKALGLRQLGSWVGMNTARVLRGSVISGGFVSSGRNFSRLCMTNPIPGSIRTLKIQMA